MRAALRQVAETLLLNGGFAHVARTLARGRTLILVYHNIAADGADLRGDTSLHLSLSRFSEQLEFLQQTHEVVPLDAVLASTERGAGRPRAAITFDDAYRGAVTVGVQELVRRGLPATIFVAPACIERGSFWWDAMVDSPGSAVTGAHRRYLLTRLRGEAGPIREWGERFGLRAEADLDDQARPASEEDLLVASKRDGITVGSHSWSHPNLTRLTAAELREELERPVEWLKDRFESFVPWLSYPYGLSSPVVERAAAVAGYRAALRISGGYVPRRIDNPYALPRLNVPAGLSRNGFVLRASGFFAGGGCEYS